MEDPAVGLLSRLEEAAVTALVPIELCPPPAFLLGVVGTTTAFPLPPIPMFDRVTVLEFTVLIPYAGMT